MQRQYEIPTLLLIGRADEVVLGPPGGGWDGDGGMVAMDFEFEDDGQQSR
jgi:hypothetical protein